MKVALCFSGQARFIKEGSYYFSKNLVGYDDVDVFIHSWEDNQHNEILKCYSPENCIIEPQKYDIVFGQDGLTEMEFVHYSMFYSIMKSDELRLEYEKRNNFVYDCVIRSRFDVALLDKLNVLDYDLSFINSPDMCRNPKVISDWLLFSNSDNMKVFSKVYESMVDYKMSGVMMTSGEELMTHHMRVNDLSMNKTSVNMPLIRNNRTSIGGWIYVGDLK